MFGNVKPKWYIGIGVLFITIAFFIFGAVPLQARLGMWGLAITELAILVFALIPIWLFKWKFKDVIPIKKVTSRQLSATILFFFAALFTAVAISNITGYFFPKAIQTGNELTDFYLSVPLALSVAIMGIMPGICEEVLHRGLILYTLKSQKNDTVKIILMAAIFGIFHIDPYRFLPTALIGLVLSYIMIKTENILLPVLLHFANNAVSVLLSYLAYGAAGTNQMSSMPLAGVGAWLVLSALSPFLFYAAAKLLNNAERKSKKIYAVAALSALLAVVGISLVTISTAKTIANFSFTEAVNNSTSPTMHPLEIENAGMYDLSFAIKAENDNCKTSVLVESETGEVIWNTETGSDWSGNKNFFLQVGKYTVSFVYDCKSEQAIEVEINFRVVQTR